MADKISIQIQDLEKQGQVLNVLADEMGIQSKAFIENASKMAVSLQGFYNTNMILQAMGAGEKALTITRELKYGADIAQKCAEKYRSADSDIARQINVNEVINENPYPGNNDKTKTDNTNSSTGATKKITAPDGRQYNVVGNYNPDCVLKQGNDSFAKENGKSVSCAANSIEIIRRMNGKGDGDNWVEYMKKNNIAFEDGAIKKGGYQKAGFTELEGSKTAYGDDRRRMIYEQIIQGKAVHGNVKPKANQSHYVAFVGIADGADPNHLKDSDFLIMDPATGTVRNLTEGKNYGLDGFDSDYMYGKTDKRTLRVMS